jgi:hypothetical protein
MELYGSQRAKGATRKKTEQEVNKSYAARAEDTHTPREEDVEGRGPGKSQVMSIEVQGKHS